MHSGVHMLHKARTPLDGDVPWEGPENAPLTKAMRNVLVRRHLHY